MRSLGTYINLLSIRSYDVLQFENSPIASLAGLFYIRSSY